MSHPDAQKCRMPRLMKEVGSFLSLLSNLIGFVLGWDRRVFNFSLSVWCEWYGWGMWDPGCFDARGFGVGGHLKEIRCPTVMLKLQTLLSVFQLVKLVFQLMPKKSALIMAFSSTF